MTSMNKHMCTLNKKVGQLPPVFRNVCMCLINVLFTWHFDCTMYLVGVSVLSDLLLMWKTVICQACPVAYTLKNQNIIALSWPAKSPDLVPNKHVWDILWLILVAILMPENVLK